MIVKDWGKLEFKMIKRTLRPGSLIRALCSIRHAAMSRWLWLAASCSGSQPQWSRSLIGWPAAIKCFTRFRLPLITAVCNSVSPFSLRRTLYWLRRRGRADEADSAKETQEIMVAKNLMHLFSIHIYSFRFYWTELFPQFCGRVSSNLFVNEIAFFDAQ